MTEEKENKDKQAKNIVGLDDDDLKEDVGEGEGEEKVSKQGLLNKYKKFIMPVAIALGTFLITIVGSKFIGGSSPDVSEEVSVEGSEYSESGESNTDDSNPYIGSDGIEHNQNDKATKEIMNAITIDTAAIMADLAFLDYTPEMEAKEKKQEQITNGTLHNSTGDGSGNIPGMTPQDSVDTLNWLNKEMTKLDKAKAENAKQTKKLKALEYKIDQALVKIEQAESARIINVARLYDGMRPKQVGKLFENLDDKAVLAILPRMKSANAAKILAIMPPKRAARISTKMITVLE